MVSSPRTPGGRKVILTKIHIEEIKTRTETATEGPWIWDKEHCSVVNNFTDSMRIFDMIECKYEDMNFIINARADIPNLIESHEILRDLVEGLDLTGPEVKLMIQSLSNELAESAQKTKALQKQIEDFQVAFEITTKMLAEARIKIVAIEQECKLKGISLEATCQIK